MKYRCFSRCALVFPSALIAVALLAQTGTSSAQEKKSTKPKAPAIAKNSSAGTAKPPGAATKYDQLLAANMKLLNVLSRYADTLAGATDPATAGLALNQIEVITKDAITAGEVLVKLGRPTPDMEAKLARDPDLEVTSRRVAEQTRSAVKALASNAEVKTLLTPAIENFQSALNRIQQDADDPKGPGVPVKPKASLATAPAGKQPGGSPAAPKVAVKEVPSAAPNAPEKEVPSPAPEVAKKEEPAASEASSVPPPPPPQ